MQKSQTPYNKIKITVCVCSAHLCTYTERKSWSKDEMNDFQLEILLASSINTGLIFQNNNTTDEKDGLVHPTSCVTLYYVQCHSSGSRLKDNIHAGVISNQAVGKRADTYSFLVEYAGGITWMLMRVLRPPVVKLGTPAGVFTALKHGNGEGNIIYSLGTTPVCWLKFIRMILFWPLHIEKCQSWTVLKGIVHPTLTRLIYSPSVEYNSLVSLVLLILPFNIIIMYQMRCFPV